MKITAAFLVIGNEILSGRTQDKNINFLAIELTNIGVELSEVRVVGDYESLIVKSLNELRRSYDYVFTSGGIGPTHDDITSESVAKAMGMKLELNDNARMILENHYGKENVNEARLKMAYIPKNAKLLDNPISAAPGYIIENVIVMAGIPSIMKVMFHAARQYIKNGEKIHSNEISLGVTESVIAKFLTNLQEKFVSLSIGSYPDSGGTSIVFRGSDDGAIINASEELKRFVIENFGANKILNGE